MRKSAFVRLFAVFLAVFLIWGGQACAAASDTTSDAAKKIQLVETEGTVTVTDSSNNIVALNGSGETRLYSGYHIATGKDSVAWFSLDESKAVKLDASSDVEIRSHGRKLELLLNSGALYCNVSESVPENNTFEIRTSTTITGIRGTIVGVDIGRTREGKDTVTVFRGTVEVRLADPASENYPTIWISEGQSFSHSSNASEQEPEVPAPLNEVTEFFAESLEEDRITAPWPVKAPEEDAAEEPSAQMGKVSNLFVDGGGWSDGGDSFIDGGDPEPGQDTGSGQDPEPEQGSGSNYTVLWLNDDGTVLEKDESVADGSDPSYDGETPVKAATAQYTYTFSGWDKELVKVSGDVTYTAVYRETLNSYTVTFVNYDGTELQSGLVAYDEMPSYTGEAPGRAATAQYSYTFSGWDKELAKVTEAVTYKAVYTETVNKYTVTFVNYDGTELQSGLVAYDEMPSYTGEAPGRAATAQYTYTFSGWDKELAKVTEAITYKAVYTETVNKYAVTFVNYDDTELQSGLVAYDEMPSYTGEAPGRAATAQYSYTFSGWDKELVKVTGAVTYKAVYTESVNKYTVTFVNYDDTELQSGLVAYDEMPSYTGEAPGRAATAQYSYTFSGWDKELVKVTEAVTYKAVYTESVNKYTVTFLNEDGTELQSSQVAYGEMPVCSASLPMVMKGNEPYAFSYWTVNDEAAELEEVTGRITYTAVYEPAYQLTLHLNSLNDHFFGEMSDQYLAANGFTPGENEQGIPDERFVTKWCVKGKEVVLPDANAINMKEDTDGFFFLGWHDAGSDISESVISSVGADNTNNRVLYALYAVDEEHIGYNVEYTDNGGVTLSFGYYNADSTGSMPYHIPAGGFTESPWGSLAEGAPNGKISYLSIEFKDVLRPVSMAYWFSGLNGIDGIGFYYLDTSLVTDMNHMFADSTVYSLDLGCFNTGKVTDMSGMFENCTNLEHVYVSRQFVVTGVPEESILFSGCQGLSGEAGTEFSSEKITAVYARIDGGEAAPGYFSRSELYYDG